MSKFKAGDKVKVVSAKAYQWYSDAIGQEFTVKEFVNGTFGKYWTLEESQGGIYEQDLVAVITPKTMLKNGMRVKCRNGSMWTYLDGVFVAVTSDFSDYNYLEHMTPLNTSTWSDDLQNVYAKGQYDIMEIFDAPTSVSLYFKYDEETSSIWKRVEKSETELRLEQMQAKAAELQNEMAKLQKDIAEGNV